MRLLKSMLLALILAVSTPMIAMTAEDAAEKIAVTELPAPVKAGFTKEVPGGEITSAKKLGGDKVRYQIKYKLEGKEHQITRLRQQHDQPGSEEREHVVAHGAEQTDLP